MFTENKINSCDINCVVSSVLTNRLQKVISNDDKSKLFMIFSSFEIKGKVESSSGCLIVACDDFIVSDDLLWLFDNDNDFVITNRQPMMNLVEIVSVFILQMQ